MLFSNKVLLGTPYEGLVAFVTGITLGRLLPNGYEVSCRVDGIEKEGKNITVEISGGIFRAYTSGGARGNTLFLNGTMDMHEDTPGCFGPTAVDGIQFWFRTSFRDTKRQPISELPEFLKTWNLGEKK